jgi:hypothetical protein
MSDIAVDNSNAKRMKLEDGDVNGSHGEIKAPTVDVNFSAWEALLLASEEHLVTKMENQGQENSLKREFEHDEGDEHGEADDDSRGRKQRPKGPMPPAATKKGAKMKRERFVGAW